MNLQSIWDFFVGYLSGFGKFADWGYYGQTFQKYFSFVPFIGGAIIAVTLYIAYKHLTEGDGAGGDIKLHHVIIGIVTIDVSPIIIQTLNSILGQRFSSALFDQYMNPVDNIISGAILLLIMYSVYSEDGKISYIVGSISYLMPFLMSAGAYSEIFTNKNTSNIGVFLLLQIFGGALVIGLLCIFFCHRKFFYSGWLAYFAFHVIGRFVIMVLQTHHIKGGDYKEIIGLWFNNLLANYTNTFLDIAVFLLIFLISFVYERHVFIDMK